MTTIPGKWRRPVESVDEGDSCLISRPLSDDPFAHEYALTMGVVTETEPEPGYVRVSAIVRPETGFEQAQVAWPGPNIAVGRSGQADGSREEIHGFYDAPLPGQSVLMGFVNGRTGSPVVIQKYSSRINPEPHLEGLHDLPLTSLGHDSNDVLIGSFTGSLIALRGGVPIPGQVEIRSAADTTISASAGIVLEADTAIEISASAGITVEAGASVTIEGSSVGLGPEPRQPLLLGDDTTDWLDDLLTAIQALTVTCTAPGTPSSTPINAGDFAALAAELETLKSAVVETG